MYDLQVLQNKAARIILDLPPRAKLHWKLLLRKRAKHRAIFVYKSINKFFRMPLNLVLIFIFIFFL